MPQFLECGAPFAESIHSSEHALIRRLKDDLIELNELRFVDDSGQELRQSLERRIGQQNAVIAVISANRNLWARDEELAQHAEIEPVFLFLRVLRNEQLLQWRIIVCVAKLRQTDLDLVRPIHANAVKQLEDIIGNGKRIRFARHHSVVNQRLNDPHRALGNIDKRIELRLEQRYYDIDRLQVRTVSVLQPHQHDIANEETLISAANHSFLLIGIVRDPPHIKERHIESVNG
mmetsp:Transcript_53462/g.85430  ORF Transcript_53462/g.85430 Transcript_53462/m.85430 type:complete len:232 (-) Transcript_53462:413-1108(-)